MNSDSPSKLRNGKTISKIPRPSLVTPNSTTKITDMDNPELTQSSSQDHLAESQRELENKVDSLKGEIDGLKSLLERLVQQGEQRSVRPSPRGTNERNIASSSDMVTGVPRTHSRPNYTYLNHDSEDEYDGSSGSHPETEALLSAINQIPQRIQKTNTKLLQTHVPNFKGQREKYNEFEHLLLNHIKPVANKISEEEKIHFFQSLLREEAIEFWQTIPITTTTTLAHILDIFRKEFAKEDMKEVARYKWNEAKYDPSNETFSDFLKNLKKTAKQAFGADADHCIRMFLFGKLPVEIQQELTMANKEDSTPEEIKLYLQRKYQYQQILTPNNPATVQPFNQMSAPTYTQNKPGPQQQQTTEPNADKPPFRKFEGKCFYCGKMGHRKQECRSRLRDEANGTTKPDAIPRTTAPTSDKPKYNPKLVCQICGYTGHSARDCRKRIPKESSTPYGKVPYNKADQEDSKERRRELRS